jgi:hypothetical protein
LFGYLKAALLPKYADIQDSSMTLEEHLDELVYSLRSHLKLLEAQKASQRAQNAWLKNQVESLKKQEQQLIAAAVMKAYPRSPQSLISQVEKEVLAELK